MNPFFTTPQTNIMRILVIGGGAAGVSTALSLKELGQDVQVELWEGQGRLGGMASSARTEEGQWYNNGVQGVHASFVHTRALLRSVNFGDDTLSPTSLTSCFVTPKGTWISGVADLSKYRRSIHNFGRMCTAVLKMPKFFGIWTIVDACRLFAVSRSFVQAMVLPTLALFFGTGNQVENLPAPLGAQVFGVKGETKAVTIFDLDPEHFIVTAQNNMLALPPLRLVYDALQRRLEKQGVVVHLKQRVSKVREANDTVLVSDEAGTIHRFNRVVVACQIPDVLHVLSRNHRARRYMRSSHYFHDMTVTHRDTAHMVRHFNYQPERPINYFIHERTPASMDMGFALHRYQRGITPPLYQTLWLQDKRTKQPYKADVIANVLREDHWYQLGHTVGHFVKCVANLHKVQGPVLFFAGSWTLVNSHEVAVMSGIHAAQLLLRTRAFPVRTFGPPSESYKTYTAILD